MIALALALLFQAAAGTTPETAVYATKADYKVWPSAFDWYLATPELVHSRGLAGRVTLRCKINDIGALAACKVASEEPKGYGFGKAALTLAGKTHMVPTPRGQIRWVLVPYRWESGGPYVQPDCC